MTDEELAVIEEWNDKRWKQSGQQEKDYVVVRDLIAEVRRLKAENEKMKTTLEQVW